MAIAFTLFCIFWSLFSIAMGLYESRKEASKHRLVYMISPTIAVIQAAKKDNEAAA